MGHGSTGAPETARFSFAADGARAAIRRATASDAPVSAVIDELRDSGARKTFLRPSQGARSLYARLGFSDDPTGVMTLEPGALR